MGQATYDDVNLILRLYDLRRETKLRAARAWFTANFKPKTLAELQELCPPGSEHNASMRQVITYWDMAASFVNAGVLNEELFFQNNRELLLVWLRVQRVIEDVRASFKDPAYWKNLEILGNAFAEYLKRTSPGTYEAFSARVGG